jgi:hypothetical protein
LLVAQPTLDFFISPRLTQGLVDLLTDPAQLEQLITHLEQHPKSTQLAGKADHCQSVKQGGK